MSKICLQKCKKIEYINKQCPIILIGNTSYCLRGELQLADKLENPVFAKKQNGLQRFDFDFDFHFLLTTKVFNFCEALEDFKS